MIPGGSTAEGPFDLIVVGSGIAGLYAALLAAPQRRVLLVTKGSLEESNTRYAQGGIAVALAAGDSPELHLRDTLAAGDGLCDPQAVRVLTHEARDCILDLLARSVPFDREGGELAWTTEAAHSVARVLHVGGDATGAGIEHTLAAAVRAAGVTILEGALATALRTEQGRVSGLSLLLPDGRTTEVQAPHLLLATGGAGRLFTRTTNPAVATADGLAIAYRAGVDLMDLEFVQFHPTALALDGAPSFLISEAVRGEGGILRDQNGDAFMREYDARAELAPRDVVARAIHTQMTRTGTDHVVLDITHRPAELIERRFPSIVRFCREHGIDPVHEAIPVSPAAHYMMGGIMTDTHARTSLPGLYACGEAACTGVHGANRLASNSLLEGLVFARRAVNDLLAPHSAWAAAPVRDLLGALPYPVLELPAVARSTRTELAAVMWRGAGLLRSADSLSAAARALSSIGSTDRYDRGTLETANLALLASLIVNAAALRAESRGAHYRLDHPQARPEWRRHTVIGRGRAWLAGAGSEVATADSAA